MQAFLAVRSPGYLVQFFTCNHFCRPPKIYFTPPPEPISSRSVPCIAKGQVSIMVMPKEKSFAIHAYLSNFVHCSVIVQLWSTGLYDIEKVTLLTLEVFGSDDKRNLCICDGVCVCVGMCVVTLLNNTISQEGEL